MTDYTAFKLPAEERARLLEALPPAYPLVKADHITHRIGVNEFDDLFTPHEVLVTGIVDDDNGIQALIVTIDGQTHKPDGRPYDITWSLDPEQTLAAPLQTPTDAMNGTTYKPLHSNTLISHATDNPGEPYDIVPIDPPISITVQPVLIEKIGPEKIEKITYMEEEAPTQENAPQENAPMTKATGRSPNP